MFSIASVWSSTCTYWTLFSLPLAPDICASRALVDPPARGTDVEAMETMDTPDQMATMDTPDHDRQEHTGSDVPMNGEDIEHMDQVDRGASSSVAPSGDSTIFSTPASAAVPLNGRVFHPPLPSIQPPLPVRPAQGLPYYGPNVAGGPTEPISQAFARMGTQGMVTHPHMPLDVVYHQPLPPPAPVIDPVLDQLSVPRDPAPTVATTPAAKSKMPATSQGPTPTAVASADSMAQALAPTIPIPIAVNSSTESASQGPDLAHQPGSSVRKRKHTEAPVAVDVIANRRPRREIHAPPRADKDVEVMPKISARKRTKEKK